MFRWIVLFSLFFSTTSRAAKTDDAQAWATAHTVEIAFEENQGWGELGKALNAILDLATWELKVHGHEQKALEIGAQWEHFHTLYFELDYPLGDIGDHKPLSDWLAKVYQELVAALGQPLCDALHITDIQIINFGVPVVFAPKGSETWCQETLAKHPYDSCQDEYRRHFAGTKWIDPMDPYKAWVHCGLIPVIAYWVAWTACEAATYGTGWVVACMPIGMLTEYVTEKYVAPKLSDKIYIRENQ